MSKKNRVNYYRKPVQKKKLGKSPGSVTIEQINEVLKVMNKDLTQKIEQRARLTEMRQQVIIEKLRRELDKVTTNQAVMQELTGRAGVFTVEEFRTEWDRYIEDELGVVTPDGRMKGMVLIDFYNVEKELTPTSQVEGKAAGGPIFVSGGSEK